MKLSKKQLNLLFEAIDKAIDLVILETSEYQAYFKSMLQKFGVKSPMELEGEKRKEFFAAVKAGWNKSK